MSFLRPVRPVRRVSKSHCISAMMDLNIEARTFKDSHLSTSKSSLVSTVEKNLCSKRQSFAAGRLLKLIPVEVYVL